jgi:hypothetical protein
MFTVPADLWTLKLLLLLLLLGLVKPLPLQVNYNLLAVNCFMAVTGIYQLQRKIRHDLEQSGKEQPTATPAAAAAVA